MSFSIPQNHGVTRAEANEAFNHVLNDVLGRGDSSSLKSSLLIEGITDIFDLITLTDDTVDSLLYEDPDKEGSFSQVKRGDKMLLRCFISYQRHLESHLGNFDYKAITQTDFDNYRISPAYRASIQPDPAPSSSAPAPPAPFSIIQYIPLLTSCYVPSCNQERSITLSNIEI